MSEVKEFPDHGKPNQVKAVGGIEPPLGFSSFGVLSASTVRKVPIDLISLGYSPFIFREVSVPVRVSRRVGMSPVHKLWNLRLRGVCSASQPDHNLYGGIDARTLRAEPRSGLDK